VNRYVGYGSLLLLIGWLVLSYSSWLPESAQIEAPVVQAGDWFRQATVAILLVFVSIQLWLLGSTIRMLHRRQQVDANAMPTHFALSVAGEIFWTALPLLLTIALALAGYKLWASI
jgi:heme/copper-type cytochrome/quinol oxidase subunit 2